MEKSVVLRDGSVLQIFRPRGENAASISLRQLSVRSDFPAAGFTIKTCFIARNFPLSLSSYQYPDDQ